MMFTESAPLCVFVFMLTLLSGVAEADDNSTSSLSDILAMLQNISSRLDAISDRQKNLEQVVNSMGKNLTDLETNLANQNGATQTGSTLSTTSDSTSSITSRSTSGTNSDSTSFTSPRDCWDLFQRGQKKNGTYRIYPGGDSKPGLDVFCDMETDNGGWTVIQRRGQLGSENSTYYFYRGWSDYRTGFGDLNKEFWLGNENIHTLTGSGRYELRVDLGGVEGDTAYAKYRTFIVDGEDRNYTLHVGGYYGTAGNSLGFQNGMMFTTFDRDNDKDPSDNCAKKHKGAWWFNHCQKSDLNGLNKNGNFTGFRNAIMWNTWKGTRYSVSRDEMKIRPKNVV